MALGPALLAVPFFATIIVRGTWMNWRGRTPERRERILRRKGFEVRHDPSKAGRYDEWTYSYDGFRTTISGGARSRDEIIDHAWSLAFQETWRVPS